MTMPKKYIGAEAADELYEQTSMSLSLKTNSTDLEYLQFNGIQQAVGEAPAADVAKKDGAWAVDFAREKRTITLYRFEEKCSLCGRYVCRYDTELQDNCPL